MMVVFILERVPATVRGEMSRWLMEPRHCVFIGTVSGMVRDRLWEMVAEKIKGGGALLIHSSPTEQGFKVRATGDTSRSVRDCEGLQLVHIPTEKAKKKVARVIHEGRTRVAVRFSPDSTETDATVPGRVRNEPPSPSAKHGLSPRQRPPRPLGKTHPLYGPQGPADASEIALYRHDPRRDDSDFFLWDGVVLDAALEVVGVQWRALEPRNIFEE
jgi:CRISPR-associated protein Cas2